MTHAEAGRLGGLKGHKNAKIKTVGKNQAQDRARKSLENTYGKVGIHRSKIRKSEIEGLTLAIMNGYKG